MFASSENDPRSAESARCTIVLLGEDRLYSRKKQRLVGGSLWQKCEITARIGSFLGNAAQSVEEVLRERYSIMEVVT